MTRLDYTGDDGLYQVPQNTIELSDTVDWEKGHHSFKFGATGILRNMEYFRPIDSKGFFNFANGDFTGYETSEMLGGFTDTYQIGAQTATSATSATRTGSLRRMNGA